MSIEKLVYVPRNWKVNFVDETGNEQNVALRANEEYHIVCGGNHYDVTVAGIRTEEDKTYIIPKVMMYDGFMHTMEKADDVRFDVDEVTEISRVYTRYNKINRSSRDIDADTGLFTFAFDSDKYTSQYRISIYGGEFVCLALKVNADSNRRSRPMYGHIIDVNVENDEIEFMRYITISGVRDVYPTTVALSSLLGIYRYELEITDEPPVRKTDVAAEEVAATAE